MFMMFPKTSFTSKSVHFVWSQLQHSIKSWYPVLEFQCSQNSSFENTRKVTISIELLCRDFQSSDIGYGMPLYKDICPSEFWKRMNAFSKKTEHYKVLSLSKTFFQVEFSV